jgi:hypothetical protein
MSQFPIEIMQRYIMQLPIVFNPCSCQSDTNFVELGKKFTDTIITECGRGESNPITPFNSNISTPWIERGAPCTTSAFRSHFLPVVSQKISSNFERENQQLAGSHDQTPITSCDHIFPLNK